MNSIDLTNKTIIVTGAAGFIGANLVKRLLADEPTAKIIGIDSVNDYYDVRLKEYRLSELSRNDSFTFVKRNTSPLLLSIWQRRPASVIQSPIPMLT